MHVLLSPLLSSQGFTSMSWYEGGVSADPPPEVHPGELLELQVYDDTGARQGTIVVGVWKKASVYCTKEEL